MSCRPVECRGRPVVRAGDRRTAGVACRCTDRGAALGAPVRSWLEVRTRAGTVLTGTVERLESDRVRVRVGGSVIEMEVTRIGGRLALVLPSGRAVVPGIGPVGPTTEVVVDGRSLHVSRRGPSVRGVPVGPGDPQVLARMPGRVARVLVVPGERVRADQPVVVLEAMKMEAEVKATRDGIVSEVAVAEGDRVEKGAVLVVVEREG